MVGQKWNPVARFNYSNFKFRASTSAINHTNIKMFLFMRARNQSSKTTSTTENDFFDEPSKMPQESPQGWNSPSSTKRRCSSTASAVPSRPFLVKGKRPAHRKDVTYVGFWEWECWMYQARSIFDKRDLRIITSSWAKFKLF